LHYSHQLRSRDLSGIFSYAVYNIAAILFLYAQGTITNVSVSVIDRKAYRTSYEVFGVFFFSFITAQSALNEIFRLF